MRSLKMLGLCLVAGLVASAVAVGSASAKTVTILFPNGGAKPNLSSVAGKGFLRQKDGAEVKCEAGRNLGRAVPGTDLIRNVVILFTGCVFEHEGVKANCSSSGQATGVIKTFNLYADLGDIKKEREKH